MLQGRTYVPLLHARLAEMRALSELPVSTKNKMVPIIKCRPWLNSKTISSVWSKVGECFGPRMFGLDLDATRCLPNDARDSYREFAALFNTANAYENYYNLVASLPYAIPVLRGISELDSQIEGQLDCIEALERGLFVRILPKTAGNLAALAQAIKVREIENAVFVFDCGWGPDILLSAASCVSLIDRIMDVDEDFELVVAGSSFPDSFAKQGARIPIPIRERQLFDEVRRGTNRGVIVYGDWGSTRPPVDPVPMKNVPRIDFALPGQWVAFRSDGEDDYERLAERVLEDSDWQPGSGTWAEYMITSTAAGLDPAIKSPAMAAAVRVNLHMHIQANLDDPAALIVADEPFEDI